MNQIHAKLWSKGEFLMTLMKLRLGLPITDLSQHFGTYLVAFEPCALHLFISKRSHEIILSWIPNSVAVPDMETLLATAQKDIARNFKNLIREWLLEDIHWNQNKLGLQKCYLVWLLLRENWPNTELFLVCIFLYSDWIQENTDQKKLRISTLFTQCVSNLTHMSFLFVFYPIQW